MVSLPNPDRQGFPEKDSRELPAAIRDIESILSTSTPQTLNDIIRYGIMNHEQLTAALSLLSETIFEGPELFFRSTPGLQLDTWNLAGILSKTGTLIRLGINPDTFSYTNQGTMHSRDLHQLPFRGYAVSGDQQWSRLGTEHFQQILAAFKVPTTFVHVLALCGGNGSTLLKMSEYFNDSDLILQDANAENIRNAMQRAQKITSNRAHLRLADARQGIGGIPFEDDSFDFITMLGNSDHWMSYDDLTRILKETFRVLSPHGYFLLETDSFERYHPVLSRCGVSLVCEAMGDTLFVLSKEQKQKQQRKPSKFSNVFKRWKARRS